MNICYLLGGFMNNGGIGRVTSILANELSDSEHRKLFTLSFFYQSGTPLYELNDQIKQDYLFRTETTMKKALLHNAIGKLRNYLDMNKIDILIACGALYFPLAVYACSKRNTKCICWEHSNIFNKADYQFQQLCRSVGSKKADYIVTLTKNDQKGYMDKYNVLNITQIYNPIDKKLNNFVKNYNSASHKIISVGRLSYQKNFFLLVDIAAKVFENYNDWEWHIYGEGEDREKLQEKINACNLRHKIILKGQDKDIYKKYSEYSFMVMTSRYEGFPMGLLEGLANGLPLISFDVLTGPKEIIQHGKNGYLIQPFSVEEMLKAIKALIESEKMRITMSEACIQAAKRFSVDTISQEWNDLFQQLVNR